MCVGACKLPRPTPLHFSAPCTVEKHRTSTDQFAPIVDTSQATTLRRRTDRLSGPESHPERIKTADREPESSGPVRGRKSTQLRWRRAAETGHNPTWPRGA